MKFTNEVEIERPLYDVIELFDDPNNLKNWMTDLQSFEHLSGVAGQTGAKSKLTFLIKNKPLVMTETITVRNLPLEFSGTYESNGVFYFVTNSFLKAGPGRTKYIAKNEFRFKGIMRLFAPLMKNVFRNQTLKQLQNFKAFAEKA